MDYNNLYIKISSKGEIDINSFLIMGGSTKREDASKIGRFGSGLKYSIAVLLKMQNRFLVFSGEEEIKFDLEPTQFRDKVFDMLKINGDKTNFSTDMGPDWDYFDVLRDIYSNAVDEGLIDFSSCDDPKPVEGETHFYIEITTEMREFMDNIDKYFLYFREDEWLLSSDKRNLRVYPSRDGHLAIYKSGFLVHEDENVPALFNYDFDNLRISESRKLVHLYDAEWDIADVLYSEANEEITEMYLQMSYDIEDDGSTSIFEFKSLNFEYCSGEMSPHWDESFSGKEVVTKESASFYKSNNYMASSSERTSIVPHSLASRLSTASVRGVIDKKKAPDQHVYCKMNSGDYSMLATLKIVGVNHDLEFDVKKVTFDSLNVNVSYIKEEGGTIILLSKSLWENENKLVSRYLEMAIHLRSETKDKLRTISYYENVIEYLVNKIT